MSRDAGSRSRSVPEPFDIIRTSSSRNRSGTARVHFLGDDFFSGARPTANAEGARSESEGGGGKLLMRRALRHLQVDAGRCAETFF